MKAIRLIVHGRVQGVFYRDWTVATARELGVVGWVRNCPDGTVEVVLQGGDSAVERLIERMASGPPAARVDGLERTAVEVREFDGFTRR